ncbi:MAG: family 10 glycosylhydrolase [Caulobacteraceae bacterium]
MKYIKYIMQFLCIFTILFLQVNANDAAAYSITGTPSIVFENGSICPIDLVDKEREAGKIAIYTGNYGEYTKPFTEGTLEYVAVNNIITYKNTNGIKGTYIPSNGYVISYTGNTADFEKNFYAGREVALSNLEIPILPDMFFKLDGTLVPIDQVNTERSANQVVLYNPSYGASTKTNSWGIEVTIVDNVITRIVDMSSVNGTRSNNDSPIPKDGMVISIHSGSPYYKQLHEMAKLSDAVAITIDNNKLYNASKIKYDAYNPKTLEDNPSAWDAEKGKPYDGYRGPNQLIVYDSSYNNRTGTNPYGYEVSVGSDGKIISTGGNDSEISQGGYILSGHGDKIKWLQKYARLGSSVFFDKGTKEATIIFTPDSYISMAQYSIKSAQDNLNSAKKRYMDIPYDKIQGVIDTAVSKLKDVQGRVKQGEYKDLAAYAEDIQKDADSAYFMTFESVKTENRAVWLRPRETSIDEIVKRLDMLKALNINTVYLEAYWNGYAIYPTGNEIMQQNPMYGGIDILGAYLKEAHARGIEIHAWVEDFLAGPPMAENKPEWMVVSRKGDKYFLENGITKYYFMNPALPEVRDFLSGLYKELARKYNLDGIQFDYMRYPSSGDYSNDFGYDAYTRQLFKSYTGTDPATLKPGDVLWQKWCEFRAHLISSFAYRTFSEVKSIKPGLRISADVWPDYDKTIVDTYQDPRAWTSRDYINNVIPMSYYLNEEPVIADVMKTWAFARGHSQVFSGIATYTNVDAKVLLRQINAIRESNTNGIGIFEFESLFNGGYDNVLKLGAFSTPSSVTDKAPLQSINKVLEDIIRKIDDIYVKNGGMNDVQSKKYKKLIISAKTETAHILKCNIENILNTVNCDADLNQEVAKRINSDLNRAINILDEYVSSQRFMTDHEVKEFQVEIPFRALESKKEAPVKVKAVFNDNTSMYLDKTQYSIISSNPDYAELTGNMLKIKGESGNAAITLNIADTFKFNTVKGISSKIEFIINPDGNSLIDESALRSLKTVEVSYTKVRLDWGGAVVDPDIARYAVYRDGKEIASTSADTFYDKDLQPGSEYTYTVCGFDVSGNQIYTSNQITVKTKPASIVDAGFAFISFTS